MQNPPGSFNLDGLAPLRRYVPLAVWLIVLLTLLIIPLKIIGYGYLPTDDALRHAAKAVSGRPWSEIMVLNSVYQIDHEFGWNLLLEKIHAACNADPETLVIFSVVSLFLLTSLAAVVWMEYPEAWLAVLTLSMVAVDMPVRLIRGRPYLVTLAALLSVLFLWRRFGPAAPRPWLAAVIALLITASVYLHGTWYLWALPVAAFFCAGQFRWGFVMAGCAAAGVVLGSALTGHLFGYPVQAVKLALLCVGAHETERTMASELQSQRDSIPLFILGGLLLLRRLAGLKLLPFLRDPVFWLACMSWTLGFKVGRFWADWGMPALMVLFACDLQALMACRLGADTFRRLALAGCLAVVTFLCLTSDVGSRYTSSLTEQFLSVRDHPELEGWMPEKGGIFYSSSMPLFFRTFYKNPKGDWQYMLGFEPTWMPPEDFKTYHSIVWNFGTAKAYAPWVTKMRPADRLAVQGGRASPPEIPQLDWLYAVSGVWLGRLPEDHPAGVPPTVPATKPVSSMTNSVASGR